jgi:hypothetical protein
VRPSRLNASQDPRVEARPGPWLRHRPRTSSSAKTLASTARPGGTPQTPSSAAAPAPLSQVDVSASRHLQAAGRQWLRQPLDRGFSIHLQSRPSTTPTRGRSATVLGDRPGLWQRGRQDQRSRGEADARPEQSARLDGLSTGSAEDSRSRLCRFGTAETRRLWRPGSSRRNLPSASGRIWISRIRN